MAHEHQGRGGVDGAEGLQAFRQLLRGLVEVLGVAHVPVVVGAQLFAVNGQPRGVVGHVVHDAGPLVRHAADEYPSSHGFLQREGLRVHGLAGVVHHGVQHVLGINGHGGGGAERGQATGKESLSSW